jgi:hypothetical protein
LSLDARGDTDEIEASGEAEAEADADGENDTEGDSGGYTDAAQSSPIGSGGRR